MRAIFESEKLHDGSKITKVKLDGIEGELTLAPYTYEHAKKMVSAMIEAGCVDEVEDNRF